MILTDLYRFVGSLWKVATYTSIQCFPCLTAVSRAPNVSSSQYRDQTDVNKINQNIHSHSLQ